MLRRAFVLLFVAGLFGTLGVGVGIFFAPADGAETRATIAAFVDEHGGTFTAVAVQSRDAVRSAIDYITASAGL